MKTEKAEKLQTISNCRAFHTPDNNMVVSCACRFCPTTGEQAAMCDYHHEQEQKTTRLINDLMREPDA